MSNDAGLENQFTEDVVAPRGADEGRGVTIDDFVAYAPMPSTCIFMPCREPWPNSSVDARLARMPVLNSNGLPKLDKKGNPVTIPASTWLARNRSVELATWVPGFPMLIRDRLVAGGGWIERPDATTFNLYRPPRVESGDASKAGPWLDHVRAVYPDDADHLIAWLAQRVQCSQDKINHALVLGGAMGIGKDTMLAPVRYAVGTWNFQDVSPSHLNGRFNSFAKSVILRVNEGRDLGEVNRFTFYDHTKIYAAAPPEVLRVDEKHLREHYVFNCLGLIITTNHKTDGVFLPPDDRRHYVAWSDRTKDDFASEYWNRLWGWYDEGGCKHVTTYLTELDISGFDPKAPPPKTPAFWDIVNASCAPEDADLADVIDKLGNPDALTPKQLIAAATGEAAEWLTERRNRRVIPHRLERCGYVSVRNPDAKDGYWRIDGARHPIYARSALPAAERYRAAAALTESKG
jgi:hypothetical protein